MYISVPEMRASSKKIFWASKKLVTGPNGIMVAQTFCDIFFYEKKTPSDGLSSFLQTTLANGVKVVKKVITSKFRFHLIAIYALGCRLPLI
jgi:hypothetical protein